MTDLSRRGLLKAGGLAACAAALPSVSTAANAATNAPKKTPGGPDLTDNPAARASGARFAPEAGALPTSDLTLTDTFNLGRSTLDEGDVITASRWGVVRGHVQGGKLVRVTPFEHDYAPSVNLPGLRHLPYSPSRIRYPMVREGYLKNGPASRANRGKEKFVRVSWEKALELVASEMTRVYENYGPSAVFGRSYGWMSTGKVNASINLQQRLLNLMGGFIGCENSYSTAAISKILPYVVGTGDPRSTSWDVVLEKSERVVFWGCDPLVTNDIDWLTTLHNGTGYVRALKEKGTKTVSVNPIRTDTAEFLGSEQISPRPGTDCAMMLGMIHELVRTQEADLEFLKTHTGLARIPRLRRRENGRRCEDPRLGRNEVRRSRRENRSLRARIEGAPHDADGRLGDSAHPVRGAVPLDGLCLGVGLGSDRASGRRDRHELPLFERGLPHGVGALPRRDFLGCEAREARHEALGRK